MNNKENTPTAMTTTTGFDEIDATIASLHALAAWRTAHPEVPVWRSSTGAWLVDSQAKRNLSPAEIARAVADGAPISTITKSAGSGVAEGIMFIDRDFGHGVSVRYLADRDQVCTRRVVGTETVEVPDPDAPLVTIEQEIVEWDCAPILAAS